MTNAATRLRQGVRALTVWLHPVDDQPARDLLSPELLALFRQMRASERQHSLNVYHLLQQRGESDPRLLTAALLHDCGKRRAPYWLWERVIVVLAGAVLPAAAARWGQGEPVGWRRPFAIKAQHPEWGAQQVAAAGADPVVIELIRQHQGKIDQGGAPEFRRLLSALQAADDAN